MTATETINGTMTIRRMDLSDADRAALDRLAERDSRPRPQAPVLGLEIEGTLLAAISLADGAIVADPFSRTDELRALLRLRARQFRRRADRARGGLRVGRRRARPALGGGPPGSVLTLPRWG